MRRNRRLGWLIGAVVAVVAVAAVAVFALGGDDSDSGDTGGTYRVGMTGLGGLDSANPLVTGSLAGLDVVTSIYPKLCQYGEALAPEGDFAESWEVSEDGRTWTFQVRDGATWSDGEPLTAEDAAFTMNTMLEYAKVGAGAAYSGFLVGIDNVEATDETTLVVEYGDPLPEDLVLDGMCIVPIIPEHIWSKELGNGGKDLVKFPNVDPTVSGGPFELTDYEADEFAIMERNDSYYGEKPNVDRFGIQMFSNTDAAVEALQSGQVDALNAVPPSAIAALRDTEGLRVEEAPGIRQSVLAFNLRETAPNPILLDPSVREAIDSAIDRGLKAELVDRGGAEPAASVIAPLFEKFYNSAVTPVYDPDAANAVLDEAGYERGQGGIRTDPESGNPLSFEVITDSDDPNAGRTFEILEENMAEIGIELKERKLDLNTAFTTVFGEDWEIFLGPSSWSVDPDSALEQYRCDAVGVTGYTGFCSEEFDELYDRQHAELDTAARQELVNQAQQMLAEDRPALILTYQNVVYPTSDEWDGEVLMPDGGLSYFGNLTQINVAGQ